MGKAKKIGIGIGIAVAAFFTLAIIVGALAANQGTPAPAMQTAEDLSVADTVQTAVHTKSARIYDLTFRVINATQDGRIITVFVNVENHGQSIEYISWSDFRLIDAQKKLYEDVRLLPPDGEIAPTANMDFKYIFRVPEGTQLSDCQLMVLEDYQNPRYLELS